MDHVDTEKIGSGQGEHGSSPTLIWDSDQFWNTLHRAHRLSLLQSISSKTEREGAIFSLHPLIRDWLQLRATSQQRRVYAREAIDVIVNSIRMCERHGANGEVKAMLILHIDPCLSNNERFFKEGCHLGQEVTNCDSASWFASFHGEQHSSYLGSDNQV